MALAGTITTVKVAAGDTVSAGHPIADLETGQKVSRPEQPAAAPAARPPNAVTCTPEVLLLGASPGGYTAAFRAADLGKQVPATRA